MALFSVSRSAVTQSTSNDLMTLITASNRKIKIVDVVLSGNAGTSASAAYAEVGISLSTGGTTGGGALTPKKWETDSATSSTTVNTTWSAQPSLSGDPYYRCGFQAYGGVFSKPIPAGRDMVFRNGEQCSVRPTVGTSVTTVTVVFDEL